MPILRSEVYRMSMGSCPDIRHFRCAATATFKKYDFVRLNSSGEILQGPAAGNDWGSGNPKLVGMAMADAAPGEKVPVLVADDNTVFILHYASGAITNALIGATRDLRQDAAGPAVSTATTNPKVTITELIDPENTVQGRVGVIFLAAARQGDSGV